MCNHSCNPRRNVRGQASPRIPRQLRESLDPAEQMSIRGVLLALEMRGTLRNLYRCHATLQAILVALKALELNRLDQTV